MDLTAAYPRSPYDMLAGLVMLARTAEKARALHSGKLGDYIYNCPLDELLFAFFEMSPDEFAQVVEQTNGDDELASWLGKHRPRSQQQKQNFNDEMRHKCPEGEEGREWLQAQRKRLAREDLHTYFEVLDADEERS